MRPRAAVRALVSCTAAVFLAWGMGVSPARAQQAAPTAQAVAGMSHLDDIWCGPDGVCLGVGIAPGPVGAVVVLRANGQTGPVRTVPGTDRLSAIDCPAGGNCIAVGRGGVVVEVSRDGTPGPLRPVPRTSGLSHVACPTATTCLATGSLTVFPPEPHGVTTSVYTVINNGQPEPARDFPRGTSSAFGIDCPTTTTCLVVARSAIVVLRNIDGVWLPTLRRIPLDSDAGQPTLEISCASSTTCFASASGFVQTPEGEYGIPAMVPVTVDGVSGPEQVLTTQQGIVDDISCVFGRTCTVVGQTTSGAVSIDVFRGTPAAPVIWENVNVFTGVSCIAPATCGVVGGSYPNALFGWHGPVPA
ncbi:MAG TPA: hypothetical protein VG078_04860 [Acidimicrobiales bacterium]|nr:hypothetical protein [Acidimicrobiales bacterium]